MCCARSAARWRRSRWCRSGCNCISDRLRGNVSALAGGLAFKLLIGPVLVTLMYVWWLHARGPAIQITLFESAMGPQIGGAIVAIQHDLNPPLITLMVGIGITLSFVTLPAWWYVLRAI